MRFHCSQNDRCSSHIPFPSASQPALAFLIGYLPFIQQLPGPIQIKKMTVQGICTDLSLQKRENPRQEVYNQKEEFDGKILPAKD